MTLEEHLLIVKEFFHKPREDNLAKCDSVGDIVGQGHIKPLVANVEAIYCFPIPTHRQELMRCLGCIGFYINDQTVATIAQPLTNLLGINSLNGQRQLKSIFINAPVLISPNCFLPSVYKHQRNYPTIAEEALALILSLEHFEVYMLVVPCCQ